MIIGGVFEVALIVVLAVVVGGGLALWLVSRCLKIVQQGSVGVVKRLGEFKSVQQPGLHILTPFIDKMEKIDVREFPMTGDQQAVITKDNVSLQVSATIFCQVIDVKSALYEINDFQLAVDQLSRTALRAVFGELSLDQALSEREMINSRMQDHMADATAKWGVRLNRIEILDITPPSNVVQAMSEQKEAEQHKRALILKSEGEQTAAVNQAGGRKQAAVLEAEGAKQSAILRAEAEMKVLELSGRGREEGARASRPGRGLPPQFDRHGDHQPAHAGRAAAEGSPGHRGLQQRQGGRALRGDQPDGRGRGAAHHPAQRGPEPPATNGADAGGRNCRPRRRSAAPSVGAGRWRARGSGVLIRTATAADAAEIASLLNALLATTTIEWTMHERGPSTTCWRGSVRTRSCWWPKTEARGRGRGGVRVVPRRRQVAGLSLHRREHRPRASGPMGFGRWPSS